MLQLSHQIYPSSGKTILFLHGFLGSSKQWKPIVNHFKKTHQILLIDLPGHGNSTESSAYTISEVASAINDILQEERIDHLHVVGHSIGGYVGCAFAKTYPEKILSLHLVNSCAAADSASKKLQRDRSLLLIQKYPQAFVSMAITNLFTTSEKIEFHEVIERLKRNASKLSTISIINAIVAMRDRESQLEDLQNSNIPVHYIYGTEDKIITSDEVEHECHLLKVQGKIIACGHMSLITHPKEIINRLSFNE
jgi:pimeloyl-ACP methyl ester carboxylesterase